MDILQILLLPGSSFLIITSLVGTFFFFLRRNLHFILREMGFFVRIRRAKYSLGTQLLLLLKGSCFALKGCLLVSVSVCSFAQFSYSSLIFLYFNFWNISYIQYRGGNPLLFFKK